MLLGDITIAAGAEENLLCLESDRYEGEDMFVRDFGWSMRRFGIAAVDPALDREGKWFYVIEALDREGVSSYESLPAEIKVK